MSMVAAGFCALGMALLVVAAFGLFRLPDALSRQHAATKAVTLALGLALLGVALHESDAAWSWRIAAIMVLLVITMPVASHMLARAAARHAFDEDEIERAFNPED